jgi:hypothetical protein
MLSFNLSKEIIISTRIEAKAIRRAIIACVVPLHLKIEAIPNTKIIAINPIKPTIMRMMEFLDIKRFYNYFCFKTIINLKGIVVCVFMPEQTILLNYKFFLNYKCKSI